jgi:hypothetical protein
MITFWWQHVWTNHGRNKYLYSAESKWKISEKTLHILFHIWLIFSAVPLKQSVAACCMPNADEPWNLFHLLTWFWENWHFTFGPLVCVWYYFPEGTTCAGLFRDKVSINYWNLIRIITAPFVKNFILWLRVHLKALSFCSWNVHITRHWSVMDKCLNTEHE